MEKCLSLELILQPSFRPLSVWRHPL